MSVSCADLRSSNGASSAGQRIRLILFWIIAANIVAWWREPSSLERFFNPSVLPEGSASFFIADFFHDWLSARNVLEGRPVYFENERTLPFYLGIRRDARNSMSAEANAHSPTSILLALPFGKISFSFAFALWNVLSFVSLAVSLWLIVHGLGLSWPTWYVIPATAILLVAYPFWERSIHGHDDLILLLIFTGLWAAARRGRNRLAGCLLGAAVAMKLFPVFVGVYFLARREWRLLIWSLISFAVLTGITAGIIGLEACQLYLRDLIARILSSCAAPKNLSLLGFWSRLFGPGFTNSQVRITPLTNDRLLMFGSYATSVIIIIAVLLKVTFKARSDPEKDFALGLTMGAMVLLSPLAWSHNLMLLPLFVLTLWQRWPRKEWMLWLFTMLLLLLMWPPDAVMEHIMTLAGKNKSAGRPWEVGPVESIIAVSAQSIALLALFTIGVVLALRQREAGGIALASRSTQACS